MNYSKAMIDLISEARRRATSEDKPSIKLANPDVLTELNRIYHGSSDTVLKAIIKETFYLAGDRWPDKLLEEVEEDEQAKGPRYITKVYRGQTQLIEVAPEGSMTNKPKTARIYRGQAIA
ncbi:MAG: hypothetical protein KBT75_05755 [Oleispira antarctica]|uniref:Uncharacterized protein n=1 Tax=Oleispira antarctica RB-8 TaxID=698738 RepID=R4YU63_OLEAN|nr:hypothetical protein [Oleispira antarctica]MBQ0793645.1 hypothetical protein [Oleispira antarctica]CCK77598.1 conserved hypothetical protein [Oleispira antarctica RB-8]